MLVDRCRIDTTALGAEAERRPRTVRGSGFRYVGINGVGGNSAAIKGQ